MSLTLLEHIATRGSDDRARAKALHHEWTTARLRKSVRNKMPARVARNLMYAELVHRWIGRVGAP